MKMDRLNCLTGVGDCESHTKHIACEAIIASGCAEFIGKGVPGPCTSLDRVTLADPGILGIRPGSEELEVLGPRLFIPAKKGIQRVLHRNGIQLLQGVIAIDIGIRIDNNGIGRHRVKGIF